MTNSAATPTLVPGYTHHTGNHCGSTALSNLVRFHGLDLSEDMCFGLGAGAGFYFVKLDNQSPSRFINGRTARLEEEFLTLNDLPIRARTEADPDAAWEMAREVVDDGRPALLLTDLFHLDHYGNSAHFPGHAVNLAGYDDELVYLSDTAFPELQQTRISQLKLARHEQHPIMPLEGHMYDIPDGSILDDPRENADRAIARAVENMRGDGSNGYAGLPAVERFAAEVGGWHTELTDWQWVARFTYQVIERRGTGGACFRRMYARFLAELDRPEAQLADRAADAWTALATTLREASDPEVAEADPGQWAQIGNQAAEVSAAERELWTALDG